MGDLPSALAGAAEGRRRTQQSDLSQNWQFRLIESEALLWQGKFKQSLALLNSPPQVVTASAELNVKTKILQGRDLYSLHDPSAESYLAEAENLATAQVPELLGEIALAQGSMQYDRGHYAAAQTNFRSALEFSHKHQQQLLETKALGSLGRLSIAAGHYDEAIDYSREALKLSQLLGIRHIEAGIRLNMGWCYWELGDIPQAVPLLTEAERIAAQLDIKPMQESSVNNLGRISLYQHDYSAAADHFGEALKIAKDLRDDLRTAVYLNNLALVYREMGRLEEARKNNLDALTIQRRQQNHVAELESLLTFGWIAYADKNFHAAGATMKEIIQDKDTPKSLQWEAENILANVYVASNQPAQAETHFQRALQRLQTARDPIHDDEHRLAFSSREAAFYTDYIHFLVQQDQPDRALQVTELMRGRTLEEALGQRVPGQLPLATVRAFLRTRRKVVLAYWLAADQSYLWTLTPSQTGFFVLPGKQEIEAKVEHYQHNVTTLGDVERTDATGRELYRILVEPARKFIPAQASVVIIPDGSLGKLNFETLIVPEPSPHFWIEDVQLEDASSIALLARSGLTQRRSRNLLAIGNPIEVTSDYPKLKYADEEIEAAAAHFQPNEKKIFEEATAVPSAYISSKPVQFDILHFATHGFASDTHPLDSAIILSPGADKTFKLYGRDIIKIPLKAEIVTISACYGAGKRTYSGEGLVGLAWAFLRAGAHQVIAGLWNVEDRSIAELMQTFYAEVADRKRAEVALRDAKLKMLHSTDVHRLPYYWASLQLYTGS